VGKVNAKKMDLINTLKYVGLREDINSFVESMHALHERPHSLFL